MNKIAVGLIVVLSVILIIVSALVFTGMSSTNESPVSIVETPTGYTITSEDNSPTEVVISNPEYQVYALKHYSDQGVLINTEYITADEYELRFNISHWSYYTLEGIVDDPFNPYNYYNWNSTSQVMQDGTGLKFEVADNGCIKVNNNRYVGFALTGTVNGNDYKYTSMDYDWEWTHVNDSGDHVFTASNNDPQILWEQRWYFYEDRSKEMKIEHYMKNELAVDITNTQMYYIITVEDTDSIQYNGSRYTVGDIKPYHIKGNFTENDAVINFNAQYDFRIDDIVSDNFTINEFYIGNGSVVGKPNIDIMAIGFTKNNGVFPSGAEVLVDPTFSTNDINGMQVCALDSNTIVIIWYDYTEEDSTFAIYDTNGTVKVSATDIDINVGSLYLHPISVSAFNSTHFVVAWNDRIDHDASFAIYNSTGGLVVSEVVVDSTTGPGSFSSYSTQISVATLNSTHFVVTWNDKYSSYVRFAIYDSSGTKTYGPGVVFDIIGSGLISISTFNSTHFVIAFVELNSPTGVYYDVYDSAGNNIIDNAVISSDQGYNCGGMSVSTFNDTHFVIGWFEGDNDDISFSICDSNGSVIVDTVDVDTGVSSHSTVDVSMINSTHFVLGWNNDVDDEAYFVICDSSGNIIVSEVLVDDNVPNSYSEDVSVFANTSNTELGICNDNFVFVWKHNSSNSSWTTYHSNGTAWDGICDTGAPPADTTLPTYSNNNTNTTTASASCNFTIDYNDDTALHTLGQYKFSTNNSGSWLNSSLSNFTSTPQTIYNNTLTLNSTVGAVIGYRWYVDDNAGNVNNTPIYTITITNVDPAISFITPPTPVNDSTNTTGEVYINVSVSDPYDDLTAFVNWNESLVGWWTFNDESLVDLSGYNNNGTFYGNNSENWTVGKFGDSANFSRINKTYVGVGNDSSLYPGEEFTVDLWIKPDPDQEFCYNATLNHGNYGIIAIASDPWSSSTWSYQLRYGSADNCSLGMQVNTGLGSKWVTVGYNLSTTEFTHIVVTVNSTKMKLYVNKTLTDTESYTSTYIKNNTNNEFMIGIDGWGNSGTLYSGSVDDVKLWNRAISHDEVNSSYDAKTYDLNITYSDLNNGETYNFIAYVQDEHGAINETEIRYVDISTADDTTFTVTLPVGQTQMNFTPSGHSDKNETPGGQTDSIPFYNVTNNGNVNLDIKLKYNTSVSTITLKVDTDNNPAGSTTISTSLQTLQSSLGQGSSCDLWFWTDFTQSIPQTTYRTIEVNVSKS